MVFKHFLEVRRNEDTFFQINEYEFFGFLVESTLNLSKSFLSPYNIFTTYFFYKSVAAYPYYLFYLKSYF